MRPLCLTYILLVAAAEAVNLHQEQLTVTKSSGKSGVIECRATGFNTGNIHWYQQKDGEALKWILFMHKGGGKSTKDPDFEDYQAEKAENSDIFTLTIPTLKTDHVATYYCASFDNHSNNCSSFPVQKTTLQLSGPDLTFSSLDLNEQKDDTFLSRIYLECDSGSGTQEILQFGSGSKLIITDENQLRKPKVTVYLAFKPEPNGKTTLLCLARDMFPDLVKISWKMEDENGRTVEVPKAEMEQLEQREEGQTTSMIIMYQGKADAKYICSVEHEAGPEEADTSKGFSSEQNVCSPSTNAMAPPYIPNATFQSMCSLRLASLVYTVMILKSMVYCSGLPLLLHHRNMGNSPPT
ncbi:immunoglobulin kappa light chain [Oncorhynchus mykiss]|uniref:immunoglobulin kappa light chain n=1 Tax=Oncorhynchus mykiss TaxID=8022 RepID=UPI00187762CC|nr:immunoglobulin kappa light chain [Oncorhynchus mykiss]